MMKDNSILFNRIKKTVQNVEPSADIILYGSYARGEQKEESDIDVLLLSDNVNFNDDNNTGIIWTTAFNVDPRIEPYGVSKKRFIEDDYLPLFENVKAEGIEIKA